MGQKVSPIGMRVGVIRDWESRWYAEKDYGTLLMEDVKIREFLFKELHAAYVSRIEIERSKNRVEIIIRAARPGVIIGSNGESIEILKKKLQKMCNGRSTSKWLKLPIRIWMHIWLPALSLSSWNSVLRSELARSVRFRRRCGQALRVSVPWFPAV